MYIRKRKRDEVDDDLVARAQDVFRRIPACSVAGLVKQLGCSQAQAQELYDDWKPKPKVACALCGATEQERRSNHWRTRDVESSIVPVEGRYCDSCRAGLDSGEYMSVGFRHEKKGHDRCWSQKQQKPMTLDQIIKEHGPIDLESVRVRAESEAAA